MMKRILTALALLGTAAAAEGAAPIEGRWTNPKHSIIVNVVPCGEAYCGRVSWASQKAKQKTGDALVGMELMSGFRPDGRGGYKGRVFEPRHDLRGSATIRMVGSNAMEVRGCALVGLLCKEQRWTRVR
jgi:uncharacterized protein (DUF2147 family)